MEPDYRYPQVYTVGSDPNLTCYPAAVNPVLVPTLMKKRKDWQKTCTVMILILTFIILACLALGAFYLFQLHKKLDKIKQVQDDDGQQAKIVGPSEIKKAPEIVAHLTGMNFIKNSMTLVWDAMRDLAFTQGVSYSDGALIIKESGYYLIYSKVYFRGQECQSVTLLEQTVFKRTERYPKPIGLMKTRSSINCLGNSGEWSRDSFQSGIFNLSKGERIYVNVSNPSLVNFDQFNTFFGLHKV
ncbi:tumor necrosis factor ligand superfamily member 6-like [Cetorhinus maximus]